MMLRVWRRRLAALPGPWRSVRLTSTAGVFGSSAGADAGAASSLCHGTRAVHSVAAASSAAPVSHASAPGIRKRTSKEELLAGTVSYYTRHLMVATAMTP